MKVLQEFIHLDQSCFLKHGDLRDSSRQVINIINFSNKVDAPVLVMFIDVEKAFDSVEWGFLLYILEKLDFGIFSCIVLGCCT